MDRVTRRRVIGEQAMISDVRLEAGCQVPLHAHDNEQFALVLAGSLRFELGPEGEDQAEIVVRAGEVMHLPSGLPHAAEALEDSHVLDVFAPPSETTGVDRGA